jgi:hypothetical protein
MEFPKKYVPDEAPTEVLGLVARLVPSLLDGDHPALVALREQYRHARVRAVELTGVGFYVDFEIPANCPLAAPRSISGGQATITLEGIRHGAGCVLFVRDGRLSTLEGFTYDDPWPENARVLAVDNIIPIIPSNAG